MSDDRQWYAEREDLLEKIEFLENEVAAREVFMRKLSHELRAPVGVIAGMAGIAKKHTEDNSQASECLDKIDLAAQMISAALNSLVARSALVSEELCIASEPFNFKALLSLVSLMFFKQMAEKGVHYDITMNNVTEELLIGDKLRLNQILTCLLSNALRFTDAGGSVAFTVSQLYREEGGVDTVFTVEDTGCGMTEEQVDCLYDAETSTDYALGMGVNLAITKRLVELWGGDIKVISRLGAGTAFTVRLPFGVEQKDVTGIPEKDRFTVLLVGDESTQNKYITSLLQRIGISYSCVGSGSEALEALTQSNGRTDVCIVDWRVAGVSGLSIVKGIRRELGNKPEVVLISAGGGSDVCDVARAAGANRLLTKPIFQSTVLDMLMELAHRHNAFVPQDTPAYDFSGKRVLIAEDNALQAEVTRALLENVGATVDCVDDGAQALLLFKSSEIKKYDLILMDLIMPVMNGNESARRIRGTGSDYARSVPIIALTAEAFPEDIAEAKAAGMNDYVTKPIDTDWFYQVIAAQLDEKR